MESSVEAKKIEKPSTPTKSEAKKLTTETSPGVSPDSSPEKNDMQEKAKHVRPMVLTEMSPFGVLEVVNASCHLDHYKPLHTFKI